MTSETTSTSSVTLKPESTACSLIILGSWFEHEFWRNIRDHCPTMKMMMPVGMKDCCVVKVSDNECTVMFNYHEKAALIKYMTIDKLPEWMKQKISLLSCAQKEFKLEGIGINHGDGNYTIYIDNDIEGNIYDEISNGTKTP